MTQSCRIVSNRVESFFIYHWFDLLLLRSSHTHMVCLCISYWIASTEIETILSIKKINTSNIEHLSVTEWLSTLRIVSFARTLRSLCQMVLERKQTGQIEWRIIISRFVMCSETCISISFTRRSIRTILKSFWTFMMTMMMIVMIVYDNVHCAITHSLFWIWDNQQWATCYCTSTSYMAIEKSTLYHQNMNIHNLWNSSKRHDTFPIARS